MRIAGCTVAPRSPHCAHLQLGGRLFVLAAGLHSLVNHSLLLANGLDQGLRLCLLLLHNDLLLLQVHLQVGHLQAQARCSAAP